jgi:hypothetical protein
LGIPDFQFLINHLIIAPFGKRSKVYDRGGIAGEYSRGIFLRRVVLEGEGGKAGAGFLPELLITVPGQPFSGKIFLPGKNFQKNFSKQCRNKKPFGLFPFNFF